MARPTSLSVSVTRRAASGGDAGRTVVWLRGEHDIATKVAVAVAIARAAQRGDTPVLVDLSGVTFMDATTVGAIIGGRNRLLSRHQQLDVRAPSRAAARILELCDLTHLVRHTPVHAIDASSSFAASVSSPVAAQGNVDHT